MRQKNRTKQNEKTKKGMKKRSFRIHVLRSRLPGTRVPVLNSTIYCRPDIKSVRKGGANFPKKVSRYRRKESRVVFAQFRRKVWAEDFFMPFWDRSHARSKRWMNVLHSSRHFLVFWPAMANHGCVMWYCLCDLEGFRLIHSYSRLLI